MGVFTVPIKVRNWQNRYLPPEQQGQEVECEAIVDSGAVELALPVKLIEKLKLEQVDTKRVFTADGAHHKFRVFGVAEVEVQGRACRVQIIELGHNQWPPPQPLAPLAARGLPHGAKPLLGAVPLEEMDWHITPTEKKLLPNPESPHEPLLPLC